MKKVAMLGTFLVMLVMLTGCTSKPFTCYMCGEESNGNRYEGQIFGEKATMCPDCYKMMNEMARALTGK